MRYIGEISVASTYSNKLKRDVNYGSIYNLDDRLYVDTLVLKSLNFMSDKKFLVESHIVTFSVINTGNNIEAIDILAIEDEFSKEMIIKCINSINPMVWLSVLKNAEKIYTMEGLKNIILPKLGSVDKTGIDLGEYIPKSLYYSYPEIRKFFLDRNRFRICTNLLKSNKCNDSYKTNVLIPEIEEVIRTDKIPIEDILKSMSNKYLLMLEEVIPFKHLFPHLIRDEDLEHKGLNSDYIDFLTKYNFDNSLLEVLPLRLIFEQLFELLPTDKKIIYIVEMLNNKKLISSIDIQYLISLLESISCGGRKSLLDKLKWDVKNNHLLFKYLGSDDQLKIMYDYGNSDLKEVWNVLSSNTKILFIYSLAKRRKSAEVLNLIKEESPIIRALMNILWVKDYEHKKEVVFNKSHNMIQNYIVDYCWESTEPIYLWSLLPKCPKNIVMYCEGKEWIKKDSRDVYCPRKGNSCPIYYNDNKIYPNQNLDFHEWSIMELLEYSELTPSLLGLYNPKEYVNKLSGWVNRLNEIRARLKCTSCGKTLIANRKYSKKLAAYNSTVFSCECGDSTNTNVYISHCWACREIIDSREGNFRLEHFYLCLKCGSGNQNSQFKQGTYCPQCGSRNMQKQSNELDNRDFKCNDCGHSIHIPPEHKWTGSEKHLGNQEYFFDFIESNE